MYDAKRYRDAIDRGARYVIAARGPNGLWSSARYRGPFYPTYVCSRFLAAVLGTRGTAPSWSALAALQRTDGGWGLEGGTSDLLSTSLALLSLAMRPLEGSADAAQAGVAYLEGADFSTAADLELIVPGTRAAPTLISRRESCDTKTVAVAFALRALIAARTPARAPA